MQDCFICYTDSLKSGFISLCGQEAHKICIKCLLHLPSDESGNYCCPMCRKQSEFHTHNNYITVAYSKSSKNRYLAVYFDSLRVQYLKIVFKTDDPTIKIRENWVRPFCSKLLPPICAQLVDIDDYSECEYGCYKLSIKRNYPPYEQQIQITVARI